MTTTPTKSAASVRALKPLAIPASCPFFVNFLEAFKRDHALLASHVADAEDG